MIVKKQIVFVAFLFAVLASAQKKEEILFTIDQEKVYTSEFIRVFQKNQDIVVEDQENNFDTNLDLFIDFKLKLKEARDIKLDTLLRYKNELAKYREELTKPYLQDNNATEFLIKEAYDRTVEEVNVSHILIRLDPRAKPKDTLLAYQKIMEARNKVIEGAAFETVAKNYSEDTSVQKNAGNLGYFSAFSMVYPFENAAYSTLVGDVSQPFRTQFGYHIIQVHDKRTSRGEVEVLHIMVKFHKTDSAYSENKINDIYIKLQQGDDFATIAKEHSDDLGSAKKGGKIPKFGTGRMIKPFENIAFDLKEKGDFSKPFKTNYGWHILKLEKKYPIKSYDELHDSLENKIKNSNRFEYAENVLALRLSKKYLTTENKVVLASFYEENKERLSSNKVIYTIEKEEFTSNDFFVFLKSKKDKSIEESFLDFKNESLINYYKNNLEYTNKEFANTYKEYQDGLLLFELLQQKIWNKAEKDTIGLTEYFNANKQKYTWKKRASLTIASCTNNEKAIVVKKYLEAGKTTEEIKEILNEGALIHVLFSSGVLEEDSSKLPKNYLFNKGVSKIYNEKTNQYTIIKVDSILPVSEKKLEETRGEAISDYQNYLEEEWVKALHEKYTVTIHKRSVKKVKRQFKEL